jgi:hypothetical protein
MSCPAHVYFVTNGQDIVLDAQLSNRLKLCSREDLVSRFGGDFRGHTQQRRNKQETGASKGGGSVTSCKDLPTLPEGLCGVLTRTNFVLGVKAAASSSRGTEKSGRRSRTGRITASHLLAMPTYESYIGSNITTAICGFKSISTIRS